MHVDLPMHRIVHARPLTPRPILQWSTHFSETITPQFSDIYIYICIYIYKHRRFVRILATIISKLSGRVLKYQNLPSWLLSIADSDLSS
jgi:hypothetical protein